MAESLADRARVRLREEMKIRHLSQRDVAHRLEWDQARVSRLLSGEQELRVDDLGALCFAIGLQPAEAIRDRGLEFYAEMTPTEVRMFERIREAPHEMREALMTLLGVRAKGAQPERYAKKPKPLLGKPRTHASGS